MRKRYAGVHSALTKTQLERDALKTEAETLRAWKAQQEEADMTEVQKLTKKLTEQEAALAAARSEVQREKLARQFPLAAEQLGDDAFPSEETLARLEAALKAGTAEPEQEPYIDPNNPRRTPLAQAQKPRSKADAIADLMAAGLPEFTK